MSNGKREREPIRTFRKDFRFLSNFWPAEVAMDWQMYPTVEHAYQAAKTTEPTLRALIRALETPGQAKRAGAALDVRPDWDDVRVATMLELTEQKYQHPHLAKLLLATGDRGIFEGNDWCDTFWGRCDCDEHRGDGENVLGGILTVVRARLRAEAR